MQACEEQTSAQPPVPLLLSPPHVPKAPHVQHDSSRSYTSLTVLKRFVLASRHPLPIPSPNQKQTGPILQKDQKNTPPSPIAHTNRSPSIALIAIFTVYVTNKKTAERTTLQEFFHWSNPLPNPQKSCGDLRTRKGPARPFGPTRRRHAAPPRPPNPRKSRSEARGGGGGERC